MLEITMKSGDICPRCGGSSLAEWLDGDTSCWLCGYVIYRRAPAGPDTRVKATFRRRRPRIVPIRRAAAS